MEFSKKGNIFQILLPREENRSIFLGVSFSHQENQEIGLVEMNSQPTDQKILKEITIELKSINKFLKSEYKVSKIYYDQSNGCSADIYRPLLRSLIRTHYFEGESAFRETP